jgi:hypothetical protein
MSADKDGSQTVLEQQTPLTVSTWQGSTACAIPKEKFSGKSTANKKWSSFSLDMDR